MTFYTNVQNWGGKIHYRGIDKNGKHRKLVKLIKR